MTATEYRNQICKGCRIFRCDKRDGISAKSNSSDGGILATCIATAIAAFMLTACSDGSGMKSFHSSDEAIKEYHGFLTTLRKSDKVSIQTLTKTVKDWRTLDDSVASCIARDTIGTPHSYPYAAYRKINDSIHVELCRMVMSRQRSYHDLLYLREQTSPYAKDEELRLAVKKAMPFFASLDSLPVYNKGGRKAVVGRYLQYLQKISKEGIHNKEGLLAFIKEEHSHFRAFLQYLPECAGNNVSDIRDYTEQCCVQILRAADRKELSHKDAMIFLAMRTNLRLIRNAQAAIEDLRSGGVKSEQALHAYLLMMVQPFMSMDELSVSVLSDKDKEDFYRVADDLPKEMDNLAKTLRLDRKRMSDLPMLMMKIYVTRL